LKVIKAIIITKYIDVHVKMMWLGILCMQIHKISH